MLCNVKKLDASLALLLCDEDLAVPSKVGIFIHLCQVPNSKEVELFKQIGIVSKRIEDDVISAKLNVDDIPLVQEMECVRQLCLAERLRLLSIPNEPILPGVR